MICPGTKPRIESLPSLSDFLPIFVFTNQLITVVHPLRCAEIDSNEIDLKIMKICGVGMQDCSRLARCSQSWFPIDEDAFDENAWKHSRVPELIRIYAYNISARSAVAQGSLPR